jgi:hypothetical protein
MPRRNLGKKARRAEGPNSRSEIESLGVGFERKCADDPGHFCEARTVEKKFAASLAVGPASRENNREFCRIAVESHDELALKAPISRLSAINPLIWSREFLAAEQGSFERNGDRPN